MFSSCKKVSCDDGELNQNEVEIDCGGVCNACPIIYPNAGSYGTNMLNADSISLMADGYYSMRAEIPEGSSLKIII